MFLFWGGGGGGAAEKWTGEDKGKREGGKRKGRGKGGGLFFFFLLLVLLLLRSQASGLRRREPAESGFQQRIDIIRQCNVAIEKRERQRGRNYKYEHFLSWFFLKKNLFFVLNFSPSASADVKDGFAHTKDSASSSSSSSEGERRRRKKETQTTNERRRGRGRCSSSSSSSSFSSTFWPARGNFPYLSWKHGEEGRRKTRGRRKKKTQKIRCPARTDGRTDGKEQEQGLFIDLRRLIHQKRL